MVAPQLKAGWGFTPPIWAVCSMAAALVWKYAAKVLKFARYDDGDVVARSGIPITEASTIKKTEIHCVLAANRTPRENMNHSSSTESTSSPIVGPRPATHSAKFTRARSCVIAPRGPNKSGRSQFPREKQL